MRDTTRSTPPLVHLVLHVTLTFALTLLAPAAAFGAATPAAAGGGATDPATEGAGRPAPAAADPGAVPPGERGEEASGADLGPARASDHAEASAAPVSGTEELGPPVRMEEVTAGTLLLRTERPGVFLPAPTLHTDVDLHVTGIISRARVTQRFHNPTDVWVEGVYVFPLPDTAAVDTLKMVVGERIIEGRIEEREEAKKVYEEAKREGKKASLVEQERPNVFTTSVANIGPDETVEVVIEYQEDLRYDHGRFSLRFPMVVAPRFIPGTTVVEGFSGTGWAFNTPQVPDAERITPPVLHPSQGAINPVSLRVELEPGFPLARLECPSHAITRSRPRGTVHRVELAAGDVPADSDFVLEWEPAPGYAPQAALFTQGLGGEVYALLMVMPPAAENADEERLPRDVVFVIDTSGSMAGTSIREARRSLSLALGRLGPGDRFNVIQFNSHTSRLFASAVPATAQAVAEAQSWVERLDAGGGTQMLAALAAALQHPESAPGVRQVVFITDGAVGNESELFAYIHDHLGPSRLFTVGIGSAPNSHFMRKAAEFGRGTFTFIGSPSEVAARMGELFAKLESPVLSNIEVSWGETGVEAWPARVPDLYLGEPVIVAARLPRGDDEVTVSGLRGEEPWQVRFDVSGGARETGLDKLWARKQIAALMDGLTEGVHPEQVRRAVLDVALAHHMVSRYTSLVAVDVTPTAPAGVTPETRPLPVNLPKGWEYEKVFGGSLPQGGTPARLYLLAGLALLAAAGLAWAAAGRRPGTWPPAPGSPAASETWAPGSRQAPRDARALSSGRGIPGVGARVHAGGGWRRGGPEGNPK